MIAELDTRSAKDYAARLEVLPERGEGGDASVLFSCSRASFEALAGKLAGAASGLLEHGELEDMIDRDGRELLRLLLQDHFDLRAAREARLDGAAMLTGSRAVTSSATMSGCWRACSARSWSAGSRIARAALATCVSRTRA